MVVLGLGLWLVPLAPSEAQVTEVQPGARIRLRAPEELAGRAVGLVVARSADSLTFAREGAAPRTLSLRSITALELSRGKSHAQGLLRGIAIGGAIGLLLGASGYEAENCDGYVCNRGQAAALGAFGGAIIGATVGAAIGVERWERITLPVRVSALRSAGGRLSVIVTVP
jgi:hypothetical protein